MKVYHGPLNIAGIAGLLAKAEREHGIDSFSYCLPMSNFDYSTDRLITSSSLLGRMWELTRFILQESLNIDVFHFHFGNSLTMASLSDVPWLKKLGKRIYFYFHGCDIRDSKYIVARYPKSACAEHWPMACSANRKKAIEIAMRYADGVFVSTPDLLEFIRGSVWLPQPLDVNRIKQQLKQVRDCELKSSLHREIVTIAHAPSDRMIKGTHYVEQAIRELQAAGHPVQLELIERKTFSEALRSYALADIAIDQLLVGSYGRFAVEMMAMGKPVICYLREDLLRFYPNELPIVSAKPDTLFDVLQGLLRERERWPELGRRGMEYAEHYHNSHTVAARTVAAYHSALQKA